ALAGAGPAAAGGCSTAGSSGYTASVVATQGQSVTGTIDATGCDVGVYVGPGVTGVVINGATISNANDHGVLADNTTNLTVENSTVQHNGVNPHDFSKGEDKAIQLDGVSNSIVQNNTVTGNLADGGIAVADDGPNDPGALNPGPAQPVASTNDTITGNKINGNFGGCGIVIAAFNPGGSVSNVTASSNVIPGAVGQFGPNGPVIGQIVVAGDGPAVQLQHITVTGNTITGALLPGIVLHANAPNDVINGTVITGNTLSLNNWSAGEGPANTAGVGLLSNPIPPPVAPLISNTTISGNTMSNQFFGVWIGGQVTGTGISANNISTTPGGFPVFTEPRPEQGYWVAGSDAKVEAFGDATSPTLLAGSAVKATAPVVGLAPSRDRAGYWLASSDGNVYPVGDASIVPPGPSSLPASHVTPAAPVVGITATPPMHGFGNPGTNGVGFWLVGKDGGVYNFGDAQFFGSTGALHLNAPIVGMAPTGDGLGYWLVASDGGVFAFGDAVFAGSMGGKHLNAPIVGMAPSASGHGYYLVASDGGIFSFGDATFVGSTGAMRLAQPIVGMSTSGFGPGYWLVAADGGVFTFGDAHFFGSAAGKAVPGTVKAIAIQ
ncbi:MAG TPA: right-handed parallel beta-helix repeat-containing protein, partial [Acidimicrobiales bacterium]